MNSLDQEMKYKNPHTLNSKNITLETLTIRVRMTKETMELFSIPVPAEERSFPY